MENKKIALSQIGLYNPQRLSDEVVEKLFVVRKKFFQFLMERLNKEKPDGIPQHHLIIAQRGMGKTTLLKRIEVELRKKEYQKKFIPLLFPEEQYNMKNLAEFWLNSLDALADTLEFEKNVSEVKQIDIKVKELEKIKNEEDLAKLAFQFLKTFTESINRRPVLLIDNMSIIFDRMDNAEQHTLRAWLMQNGAPIVIGASVVAIEDTFDYGAPFYDAFQIHYLKKLSFEELMDILKNLAELTQADDVTSSIKKQIARIKTLYQLTGGNPRTATMLFKLIIKGFSNEINDDLEALLDEITPLYKSRFEELPVQMQVIVDAIALHWDPINLEQLREETRYGNNQLSPQLKRLAEVGWIEKIDAYQAKGNAYLISERFFNIWFLMRRSNRRQKKELYCLSKFLELFYGDEIQSIAQNSLLSKSCKLDHIIYRLALAEATKDENLKTQLLEKSYNELLEFSKSNPEVLVQFDELLEFVKSNIEILKQFDRPQRNNKIAEKFDQNFKKSKNAFKKSIELDDKLAEPYYGLGFLYQYRLFEYDKAELAYKNAIKINEKYSYPWVGLGNLYQYNLLEYNEAEKAYQRAIKLNDKMLQPWYGLGVLYQTHLQKYDEAEIAYKKAVEIDGKNANIWNALGNLYQDQLQKYYEAEKAYGKANEIDQKYVYAWNGLGNLYKNHLHKYIDAEKAYLKAIAIDEKLIYPWIGLGELYHYNLQKYQEAEKAYKKAIEIDVKSENSWNSLGNLYQDYLQKCEESEKAYKKSIDINKKLVAPQYNLVFLYRDKMNKLNEAEALLNSIVLVKEFEDSYWLNKALFELYKRNEGIAKDFFEKALQKIQDKLPVTTQDDWWRFGAVVIKLGYGKWALSILEENGYNIILSPYFVAIKAMTEKDTEGYLNSKAVEIREPAMKLIEIMKKY